MPVSRSRNEKAFNQFRTGAQDRRIAGSLKSSPGAASPRAHGSAKADRLEELKEYPVGSYILWKYGDSKPEQVVKHDINLGRIITDKKGNYDPFEISAYSKE